MKDTNSIADNKQGWVRPGRDSDIHASGTVLNEQYVASILGMIFFFESKIQHL
ncbi:MAG: hypothetical protein JWQ09_39 [Segetibacter sp.]|nr:hypothetical protein [Segetibacter sp.]